MSAGWAAVIGVVVGATSVGLLSALLVRGIARERDNWRQKTGVLVGALTPFAPVRIRVGPYPRPYWVCPSCASGGLLGSGSSDTGEAHDEAREHFIDQHLIAANFHRAGEALSFTIGDRWRRR